MTVTDFREISGSLPKGLIRVVMFALRVLSRFRENNGLLLAGAVGYNTLLSLIPLLAVLLAFLSNFVDTELILSVVQTELSYILPTKSDNFTEALRTFIADRDLVSGIGIVVLIFFSSIAFRMMENAMGVIFRHHEAPSRHAVISALIPLIYISLIGVALLFLTAITATIDAMDTPMIQVFTWEVPTEIWNGWVLNIAGIGILTLLFASFYRFMPVAKVRLRLALVGGAVASVLWELVRNILVYYFENLSLVNVVYGSLATVIVILVSMEVAAVIVLLGAQVIAELEENELRGLRWYEPAPSRPPSNISALIRDSTVEIVKPDVT